jgi:hypothetical protein
VQLLLDKGIKVRVLCCAAVGVGVQVGVGVHACVGSPIPQLFARSPLVCCSSFSRQQMLR